MSSWAEAIRRHYERFWKSASTRCEFHDGPVRQLPPDFEVVHLVRPGAVPLHIHATAGMSRPSDDHRLEVFVLSREESSELVELLYAVAHFHRTGSRLGLDHSVNIGRPWLAGSLCDHALVSLPYLDGPLLENGSAEALSFQVGWLIPVTPDEIAYRREHGTDALETLFEIRQFDYSDPFRASVVALAH